MSTISRLGGHVGAIDIVKSEHHHVVRDITISTRGREHVREMLAAFDEIEDVEVRHTSDRTFLMHLGGKSEVKSRVPITHRDELSMAYTPGVARFWRYMKSLKKFII